MDLILQTSTVNTDKLQRIAKLVTASHVRQISPYCLRFRGVPSPNGHNHLQQIAEQEQVDLYWVSSPQKLSDFKLLAMDMDSTLITIECIDEIADMQGLKPQVAAITEAAMRGEIAFAESLTRRVALLEGLPASALQRVYDERLRLTPGAEKLLEAAQSAGLKTLLVSGGFTFFTDRLKAKLSLDYSHSNQLEVVDDQLTGRLISKIVDAEEKRSAVERACSELSITTQQAIVIGDGANDLAMMEIAGFSVAFHAKPVVRAKAHAALNFVGLDGVLNLFDLLDVE